MTRDLEFDARRRRARRAISAALAYASAFFCFQNTTISYAETMSLPGKVSVGQSGSAGYSLPIALSPGSAGVAPSLSLDYNSQGGNGIVGVGWSLGGLPSIGRCARTIVQDGVLGSVNFDANDRFCLDGQRLVAVSGAYGAEGTEYRTEVESFSRVISRGVAGTGPSWFEVRTKSGQVMEFGHTTDSQILAVGKSTARAWALSKLTDTKGNYLSLTYSVDAANGQALPSRIDYTGNSVAGVSPYNSVQFTYASRPDVIQHYQAGSIVRTVVRLTNVKTYAGANMVSDYRLSYQQSSTSGNSELTSVTACAASGNCLPATTFQWSNGGGGSFSPSVATNPNNLVASSYVRMQYWTPVLMDLNGDGKTDFVLTKNKSIFAYLSNGDGSYTNVNSTQNVWDFGGYPAAMYVTFVGDFDGDGKSDFAFVNSSQIFPFLGNGDGTFRVGVVQTPANWPILDQGSFAPVSGDFNGDGRTDFILINQDYLYECISNAAGSFGCSSIWINNGWNFGNPNTRYVPITGDFNGDGKTDFIMLGGTTLYEAFGNGDGTFSYRQIDLTNGWRFGWPEDGIPPSDYMPVVGDFNGDGKTDWLMLKAGTLYMFQSRGDGNFDYVQIAIPGWNFGTPPTTGFDVIAGDFNLDGRSDFVLIGGNGPYIYQFLSKGDGSFAYNTISMPNSWNFGAPPSANYFVFGGDFNGDGRSDFALMDNGYIYTLTANGGSGDLVSQVTSGLGATASITYTPMTNGSVYTKDTNGNYPILDMQMALYVASRLDQSNGVGGTYSSSYSYAGAKLDLGGRGYLGFRQMTVKDLATGIADTTTFRQDFPFIGMVSSATRTLGAQTLGQSVNTYLCLNAGGGTGISPSSAPYRVFLTQNTSSGTDLDGSGLPTVTTTNQYDDFGNATQVVVATPDGNSKTTVNTYANDTSNWYLGRLTRATVTSRRPQ
ncbi:MULTISPECIES: FG-GAP-like repeat-containing protein [unclassified Bradyrhizobium]|uniref:FG-GAP-like repeat-containing protein n=2 Tax=unclassified Bradyrhizobium TaxID=2631580 RepID=UPI0028E5A772|nr:MULTISPECIES: FG-GAP-like repeat-containing protein [unclassified Bradyrhizobium]